jgi:hypothetical protein
MTIKELLHKIHQTRNSLVGGDYSKLGMIKKHFETIKRRSVFDKLNEFKSVLTLFDMYGEENLNRYCTTISQYCSYEECGVTTELSFVIYNYDTYETFNMIISDKYIDIGHYCNQFGQSLLPDMYFKPNVLDLIEKELDKMI